MGLLLSSSVTITMRNIVAKFLGALKSFQKTCTFCTFCTRQS